MNLLPRPNILLDLVCLRVSFGFNSLITRATRVTPNSATLIDHLIVVAGQLACGLLACGQLACGQLAWRTIIIGIDFFSCFLFNYSNVLTNNKFHFQIITTSVNN